MNIFEALSKGRGRINEENTSSFLGYLLNPIEDHGMKDLFIKQFLKRINIPESEFPDINEYDVQLEVPVKDEKLRIVDIVFKTKKHLIAIENKIKFESCQENQIIEEFKGLEKYINEEGTKKQVIICLLTPPKCNYCKYQKDISNSNFRYIDWASITNLLKNILDAEANVDINPINEYLKQTLKAFINFINNLLKEKLEEKEFKILDDTYIISKYSTKKITVEYVTDNIKKTVSARKIIRQKLAEYKDSDESCSYERTEPYNTRYLGEKLLKILS